MVRTARVTLESRQLWEFYHAGGIARDVRNGPPWPEWTEAHMFDCLAWLYDGFALPTERMTRRSARNAQNAAMTLDALPILDSIGRETNQPGAETEGA